MKHPVAALTVLLIATSLPAAEKSSSTASAPVAAATAEALPGLKVGEKAIDFTLRNAAGQEVALRDLLR